MDVTGLPLTVALMRGWIVKLTEPGEKFQTGVLYETALEFHLDAGGHAPTADDGKKEFQKALAGLRREGILEKAGEKKHGWWVRTERTLPVEAEVATLVFDRTDIITRGDGPETVYAWYLPISKELAGLKNQTTFPMKIGHTRRTVNDRMRESVGIVPDSPEVGFVLKVANAHLWERLLHTILRVCNRHLPPGMVTGSEWFTTNPEELGRIVDAFHHLMKAELIPSAVKEGSVVDLENIYSDPDEIGLPTEAYSGMSPGDDTA